MFVAALLTGLAAQTWGQADGTAKPATASESAGYDRIATIDFTRIYLECAQARDLSEMMRTREGEVQVEVRDRQRVMDEKQAAIGAFRVGTPDYEARRKELVRLGIESNVWIKMIEQDMEAQKFDWTRILFEQAQAIVDEICKERGLTLVLQTREFRPQEMNSDVATIRRFIQERTVAYARPTSDITQEVISRLDAKYQAAGGKKMLAPGGASTTPAAPKP
jgi:Skp family chaperone for outer membrane proteins